jgi:hypothetical protein
VDVVIHVYTGKDIEIQSHLISSDMNKITATVMKLVDNLALYGINYLDGQFYNSIALVKLFKLQKTGCTGPLK